MITNSSKLRSKFLYKFLKKNRCLDKFIKAVIEQHPLDPSVATYAETHNIKDLFVRFNDIDDAILWSSTDEGYDFWARLNDMFLYAFRTIDLNFSRMRKNSYERCRKVNFL